MKETTLTKEEAMAKAASLAHDYKLQGYHCSESAVRAVPEALGLKLSDDTVKAATGFFGGGGGMRDRCGIVEIGLMLISLEFGRLDPKPSDQDIRDMAAELFARFEKKFGSIYCRDVKPPEVERFGEEYGCMRIYEEGSALLTELMLDADKILGK